MKINLHIYRKSCEIITYFQLSQKDYTLINKTTTCFKQNYNPDTMTQDDSIPLKYFKNLRGK